MASAVRVFGCRKALSLLALVPELDRLHFLDTFVEPWLSDICDLPIIPFAREAGVIACRWRFLVVPEARVEAGRDCFP